FGAFGALLPGTFTVGTSPAPQPPPPPPPPTIASFTPTSGPPGTAVTVSGTNFTSTTQVGFNGFGPASFTVVSDTTLTAVVPALATTGPIQVITNGGVGNVFSSNVFTVTNSPPPPPPTLVVFVGFPGGGSFNTFSPGQT